MEPKTLEEQTSEAEQTVTQGHIDHLYAVLLTLDLQDDHEHAMAHRTIDLIAAIQEFHHDLSHPDANKESPMDSLLNLWKEVKEHLSE